jgi:cytochrome c-type biogenesis protein CcmH/NrfF
MNTPAPDKYIQKLIVWIFPSVLTILGALIYNEITGLRTDVRSLLIEQSATIQEIKELDSRVNRLEDKVFPVKR